MNAKQNLIYAISLMTKQKVLEIDEAIDFLGEDTDGIAIFKEIGGVEYLADYDVDDSFVYYWMTPEEQKHAVWLEHHDLDEVRRKYIPLGEIRYLLELQVVQ